MVSIHLLPSLISRILPWKQRYNILKLSYGRYKIAAIYILVKIKNYSDFQLQIVSKVFHHSGKIIHFSI